MCFWRLWFACISFFVFIFSYSFGHLTFHLHFNYFNSWSVWRGHSSKGLFCWCQVTCFSFVYRMPVFVLHCCFRSHTRLSSFWTRTRIMLLQSIRHYWDHRSALLLQAFSQDLVMRTQSLHIGSHPLVIDSRCVHLSHRGSVTCISWLSDLYLCNFMI